MNGAVFVDAGCWIAITLPTDGLHPRAMRCFGQALHQQRPLVTTSAVVLETVDALSGARTRHLAEEFRAALERLKGLEVVPVDAGLLNRAWDFHTSRPDKEWSLTDCLSFVVMTQRGLSSALAYDHHFEQAGFRALMREA